MKCHLAWVSRDHNFIGAELQRILALRVGSSKSNHMGTEPESELNAHVTEAADPEDVDLLACAEPVHAQHISIAHSSFSTLFAARKVRSNPHFQSAIMPGLSRHEVGTKLSNVSLLEDLWI